MSQSSEGGADVTLLRVPSALYALVAERAAEFGFESADAYAAFVLTEVTSEADGELVESELSQEEEGKLTGRLRGLGYIE